MEQNAWIKDAVGTVSYQTVGTTYGDWLDILDAVEAFMHKWNAVDRRSGRGNGHPSG